MYSFYVVVHCTAINIHRVYKKLPWIKKTHTKKLALLLNICYNILRSIVWRAKMKSVFVALQFLMYIILTACVVGPPRNIQGGGYGAYSGYPGGYGGYSGYPGGYDGGRTFSVREGAAHLNQVADPTLPHPVYRDCVAGVWHMDTQVSQSNLPFGGSASQTCVETVTRRNGVNVGNVTVAPGKVQK
jgi:hypothetical protein